MRTVEMLRAGAVLAVLSGCSSPPEPARPEWNNPGAAVNTAIPQWSSNGVIIPAADVDGRWSKAITFNPDITWPPDVWYAVAHARQVVVHSPDGASYFRAKSWLRRHGYTGVISFQPKLVNCLTCNTTEIEFYR